MAPATFSRSAGVISPYSQSYPMATAIVISPTSRKWEGFQSENPLTAIISSTALRAYASPPWTRYVHDSQNMRFKASREVCSRRLPVITLSTGGMSRTASLKARMTLSGLASGLPAPMRGSSPAGSRSRGCAPSPGISAPRAQNARKTAMADNKSRLIFTKILILKKILEGDIFS